jgi:hypothetical protein
MREWVTPILISTLQHVYTVLYLHDVNIETKHPQIALRHPCNNELHCGVINDPAVNVRAKILFTQRHGGTAR